MFTQRRIFRSAAVVAAVALAGCTSPSPVPTPGRDSTGVAENLDKIADRGALVIASLPDPDWVIATEDGAWVANSGTGLVLYDHGGVVAAEIETENIPLAMEVGFDSLWAAAVGQKTSELVRVDLKDPTSVTRIPLDGFDPLPESSIAVTPDAVWVLGRAPEVSLLRVDPRSNSVVDTSPAPVGSAAVRGGFDALWLARASVDLVDRIDPTTLKTTASIEVGPGPRFIAVGDDAVWVMNQLDGSVSRIDPTTNTSTAVEASSGSINGGDIAADADSVWLRTSAELAIEIDPDTSKVVDELGPASGSGSIDVINGVLWVSAHDVQTLWRLG